MSPDDADIESLATEVVDPRFAELDRLDALAIVSLMNAEDARVIGVVQAALPTIARAVEDIVARLERGGRLVYAGAGTSGRLAMLDAVECVPTFGVPPTLVSALVAGGERALVSSVEGAEDDVDAGEADVIRHEVSAADALVGVAASGRTPYVVAALRTARERGALTVAIADSPGSPMAALADHVIELDTGPEVVAGSTRLKAGTAQKMALNMISTATLVRLGRVFGNRMIDVAVTNAKLRRRAIGIVPRHRRHRRRDRGAPPRRLRPRGQDRGPHGPARPSRPRSARAAASEQGPPPRGARQPLSDASDRPRGDALERLGACYCRRPNQASRGGRR